MVNNRMGGGGGGQEPTGAWAKAVYSFLQNVT